MAELTPFDSSTYLETEEDILVFLDDALETRDPSEVADALAVIAKAKGLAQAAVVAGMPLSLLNRDAPRDPAPDWAVLFNIMQALGLRLAPVAIKPAA